MTSTTAYAERHIQISSTALTLAIADQERERIEGQLQRNQREMQRLLQEAMELQQRLARVNRVLRDRKVG